MFLKNKATVILGTQWGDEGKGKLCDLVSNQADVCARCQGGNNAGHTIVAEGKRYAVHLLPSGIVSPDCVSLIGSGVVVHLESLFKELDDINVQGINTDGRIFVSDRCQLVFDFHQMADGFNESELGRESIGTTRRGIGPAYSSKAARSGIRVTSLYNKDEFKERLELIATVILGTQWGDEGKGKLCDLVSNQADVCARCQGGNNAGHTIVAEGKRYAVHLLPSGIVSPDCVSLIGSGVVVHLESLFKELDDINVQGINTDGRIFVSDRCQLVFDFHQMADGFNESELGRESIGTTRRGIGPAYSSKAARSGIRVTSLYNKDEFKERLELIVETMRKRYSAFEYDIQAEIAKYEALAERLKPMVVDSVVYINDKIRDGSKVLIEGANALMLDIDFGTYPYVTSSNTGVGGALTGLGIAPSLIGNIIGVVKAYTTRVGGGPFPTELLDETGEKLQKFGAEFGVTTGRPRRCGWLDLVVLKHSHLINGYTSLNLTKLDVLDQFDTIKVATSYTINGKETSTFPADLSLLQNATINYKTFKGWNSNISKCTSFDQLPEECKAYVNFIQNFIGVPIEWIGVGVGREDMIHIPQN
ncbi:Adenylosuccinate synthetase [Smittium culicis]|uniref:Adenylosuccinate synthetase n=1 Tax=Smittium culicis TaxID=133412 RepID=A0A1R1Y9W2_9FUNG|nr:Adenylosuccinate synthetase [Smittium culicis]